MGIFVGFKEGTDVGSAVGNKVGIVEGANDGTAVG